MYRQTSGLSGYAKGISSSIEASVQRVNHGGFQELLGTVGRHLWRKLRGLPPEIK
jgi:hypothetical protein